MSFIPQNIGKAIWYAFIIWLSGFIWGTVVFMIPFLAEVRPVPYISSNLAISIPIIIIWIFLSSKLTRSYFKHTLNVDNEALKLGLVFFVINAMLDLLVIVIAFGNGLQFYLSLTVWLAYAILIIIPLKVGSGIAGSRNE